MLPEIQGFPDGSVERIFLPSRRCRFYAWVGKSPWRRKWQPTPVLAWEIPWTVFAWKMPIVGYYGVAKESDMT